jgi:K+-sensing histidine kinase KdpD
LIGSKKDTERKLKKLEKLLEVNLYLNATPNLETLLSRIISITKDVMEAYSTSIILLDEEKNELYFQKVYDSRDEKAYKDEQALKRLVLKMGEGIAGHVAQSGQPLIINDVQSNRHFSPKGDSATGIVTRNMIAIPLRAKDRIVGVMEVINRIEGDFTEDDLPMCLALGNVVTVAIENARLFFETERSLKRLAKMEASKYQLVNLLFQALRTPVSSIKGYAEYVLGNMEETTREMVADFAEIAHKEATNINKMINDLYIINEYDDLSQKLNLETLNMAEILQSLVEKRSTLQKELNFILNFGPEEIDFEHYIVDLDYEKFEHCMQHLLDIVSHYTPQGGTITINAFRIAAMGDSPPGVQIEIEDEGLVIPENLWEMVFQTLQSIDVSASQSFESLGLGLFICKKIIEAHGGQINWEKRKEAGSRIFIKLPQKA